MREKWNEKHSSDGRTYGQMTIGKAIDGNKELQEEREAIQAERDFNLNDSILSFKDLISLELPEKRTILDPWITEKSITLISGWRGTGKTWLALSVIDAITKGKSFGPWETETSVPCLYLDGEMPIQDMQLRAKQLGIGQNCTSPIYLYSNDYAIDSGIHGANLLDETWRDNMKNYLLLNNIKLWVVDNIASLAPGIDENKKDEWDPINAYLLALRFAGIATILLHHVGKGGEQRGTSAREDNIDTSIKLKQPDDYETEEGCRFIMEFKKNRVVDGDHFLIADQEFHFESGRWTFDNAKAKKRDQIAEMLKEGKSNKEIAQETDVTPAYVSKVKREQKRLNFG
jgi:putative DNA primase/helicase